MNEFNLETIDSWTIEQFKLAHNYKVEEPLNVIRSPKTDKLFFQLGLGKAAVTGKVTTREITNPMISEFADPATGETFYMLHNQGASANIVRTF